MYVSMFHKPESQISLQTSVVPVFLFVCPSCFKTVFKPMRVSNTKKEEYCRGHLQNTYFRFIRAINLAYNSFCRGKLKSKPSRTLIVITVLLTLSYLIPNCLSESYSCTYQLLDHPDGSTRYKLNVAIPQSLHQYYRDKSHSPVSNTDFARFVTPNALEPIADSLWSIYNDDEDFANGVLMIVHQIPYQVTLPVKYPVETMVENEGDCDLFSYIAASTMKAGGLDVVLLYYEDKAHMNVGVNILHPPNDARGETCYVTHESKRYYMAECTGGNWRIGWRVGECPDSLRHVSAQIISLEDCEQESPGQVSASYSTLTSSTVSLTISSAYAVQGTAITLSGKLSPILQNESVTIYVKANNLPWAVLDTVTTGADGRFMYVWNLNAAGVYNIRASWSGDNDHAGADSQIKSVLALSIFFVSLLAMAVILVCVGVIVFLASRHNQQYPQELQPPEIPS